MTEKDLLKYSKPVLAKYIAGSADFVFNSVGLKQSLDSFQRETEVSAINKRLDNLSPKIAAMRGKFDTKSLIQYLTLSAQQEKLLQRLMRL